MSSTDKRIFYLENELINLGDIPFDCLQESLNQLYPHKSYKVIKDDFKGFNYHIEQLKITDIKSNKNLEEALVKKRKLIELANSKLIKEIPKIEKNNSLLTEIVDLNESKLGLYSLLDSIVVLNILKECNLDCCFDVVYTRDDVEYTENYHSIVENLFRSFFL